MQHFHTKFFCQSPMLRQIEWGVQSGPITKKEVLPVTTFFFRKFCFNLRTWYKELIWCTNYLNVKVHTFPKHWSFTWGFFFPVSTHNSFSFQKISLQLISIVFFLRNLLLIGSHISYFFFLIFFSQSIIMDKKSICCTTKETSMKMTLE